MDFVIPIPKGKNILDFLHEQGSIQNFAKSKDAGYFMHKDVVKELMHQMGLEELAPTILLSNGNCYIPLRYGSPLQHIGTISLHPEPCYGVSHHSVWFFVSNVHIFENSPVQIAFNHSIANFSKSILLKLAE